MTLSGRFMARSLKGGEALDASLKALVARLEDRQPLYEEIGAALLLNVQRRFETGRGPGGVAWPKSIRGGQTLIDSGRLLQSMTFAAGAEAVEVGTNVLYAAAQQFGATIRPKRGKALRFKLGGRTLFARQVKLPPRPFLAETLVEEDAAAIRDAVLTHLEEALG